MSFTFATWARINCCVIFWPANFANLCHISRFAFALTLAVGISDICGRMKRAENSAAKLYTELRSFKVELVSERMLVEVTKSLHAVSRTKNCGHMAEYRTCNREKLARFVASNFQKVVIGADANSASYHPGTGNES